MYSHWFPSFRGLGCFQLSDDPMVQDSANAAVAQHPALSSARSTAEQRHTMGSIEDESKATAKERPRPAIAAASAASAKARANGRRLPAA